MKHPFIGERRRAAIPGLSNSRIIFVLKTGFVSALDLPGASGVWANRHSTSKTKPPRGLGAVVEAASSKAVEGVHEIIANMRLNKNSALLKYTASTKGIIAQMVDYLKSQRFRDHTNTDPRLL
jgi:hypothetical protein